MRMDRDPGGGGPAITGFTADGGFRIDGTAYLAALLTVERAAHWTPPALAELDADALAAILEPAPEFLLLGTGAALQRPPPALTRALDGRGIGIEAMDSRAAARAWGMLRGEGRRIAAALYPAG